MAWDAAAGFVDISTLLPVTRLVPLKCHSSALSASSSRPLNNLGRINLRTAAVPYREQDCCARPAKVKTNTGRAPITTLGNRALLVVAGLSLALEPSCKTQNRPISQSERGFNSRTVLVELSYRYLMGTSQADCGQPSEARDGRL
jgi:hypothetical protein